MNKILDKPYLCAQDIKELMPDASLSTCRGIIKAAQREMVYKKYIIPNTKTKLALTKIVIKMLGI